MNNKIKIAIIMAIAAMTISFAYLGVQRGQNMLTISTTTSLYDTGLLDAVAERYLELYNTRLDFIAAGTGQALEHARNGDADVVLVHSPSTENQFLTEGVVGTRRIIAYNFFIIIGPPDDPAGIKGLTPIDALKKIASTESTWVSRGDNSGTHTKEKSLWKKADIEPYNNAWYMESGADMGLTLTIASEKAAYTLADTGTYLKYKSDELTDSEIIVDIGKDLLNVYSVMAVNPEKNPNVKFSAAIKFIEYLTSDSGQTMLGEFGMKEYGVPLFNPAVQLLETGENPELSGWIRSYAFLENSECPSRYRLGQEQLYK
ncbi:MAG: substrate-binding domain-containing protein [Methanobacteriota archaeon]